MDNPRHNKQGHFVPTAVSISSQTSLAILSPSWQNVSHETMITSNNPNCKQWDITCIPKAVISIKDTKLNWHVLKLIYTIQEKSFENLK